MWGLLLKFAPRLIPFVKGAGGIAVAFIFGVCLGWVVTSEIYESKEQEEALKGAIERADQGKRNHEKIISISDQLERERGRVVDLRAELERVRLAKAEHASRTSKDSRRVDKAPDPRGAELLERGAELVERCGRLLQSNALKHDALTDATKPK